MSKPNPARPEDPRCRSEAAGQQTAALVKWTKGPEGWDLWRAATGLAYALLSDFRNHEKSWSSSSRSVCSV